jgi:hypothetical protein
VFCAHTVAPKPSDNAAASRKRGLMEVSPLISEESTARPSRRLPAAKSGGRYY